MADTTEDGMAASLAELLGGTPGETEQEPEDEEQETETEGDETQDTDDEGSEDEESEDDASDDEGSEEEDSEEGRDEKGGAAPKVVPADTVVFTLDDEGKSTPVTAGEAKAGYLRQSDYSRKTAEVAEQTKAIQAEREELQTALKAIRESMDAADADATPEKLAELARTNPEEAMRLKLERDARTEQRKKLEAAEQELAARTTKEREAEAQKRQAEEVTKLLEALPDLKDPEKAKVLGKAMQDAATAAGFTPEDVGGITDHRLFKLLKLAADGLRLAQKPKPKPTPKGDGVPPLKAGGGRKVKHGGKQAEREARFSETRSIDDAADSLAGLLTDQTRRK